MSKRKFGSPPADHLKEARANYARVMRESERLAKIPERDCEERFDKILEIESVYAAARAHDGAGTAHDMDILAAERNPAWSASSRALNSFKRSCVRAPPRKRKG